MTDGEREKLSARLLEMAREAEEAYERTRAKDEYDGWDGWNSPPAIIPRPAELAIGVYNDPHWNTR